MSQSSEEKSLEIFDDVFLSHSSEIEENLKKRIPEVQDLENKSIYLQILSQIAFAQAIQKKFAEAHKTLDKAEMNLTSEYELAHVRILLERGRVFQQSDNINAALPLFKQSYELSKKHGFDFHTINAARMIASTARDIDEKIEWNKRAIDLAEKTSYTRAHAWIGLLYNNLAQNYIEAKQYQDALSAFELGKLWGEEKGDHLIVRDAKWGTAHCLRLLGSLDKALELQLSLLDEYNDSAKHGSLPIELLIVGRGLVYEELAEIYLIKLKKFSALAYQDLSKDPRFVKLEPKRLKKMKQLQTLTET